MRVAPFTRGSATVLPSASAIANSGWVSHSLRNGSVSSGQRASANEGSARRRRAMSCDAGRVHGGRDGVADGDHPLAHRALRFVQRRPRQRCGGLHGIRGHPES